MKGKKNLLARARQNRKSMTRAEKIIWDKVRNRKLGGYKFRRQHPIGVLYIADFYCASVKLIVEIDGPIHIQGDVRENDKIRQEELQSEGYEVLRFSNYEVESNPDLVLEEILNVINRLILEKNPC